MAQKRPLSPKTAKIPKATITRLSLYYRQLELLDLGSYGMVSSEKLARLCQSNPAQVRKDLGYFGEFGIRGVGYDVIGLQSEIKKILAINRDWNICIVGIGNLGSALLQHQNLPARGFKCVAAFDNDPEKTGRTLPTGQKIRPITELPTAVEELDIKIGVITTIPSAAQSVADMLLRSEVYAIINFTPGMVHVPSCCMVENIDFTIKLDMLTYKLNKKSPPSLVPTAGYVPRSR
jgi:redox-sensing transcriptional repressor